MERNVAHALSLEPDGEGEEEKCDRYVTAHKQLLSVQVPFDDPTVERRRRLERSALRKSIVSVEDYDRARAVRAYIQGPARRIFGEAGDRVADVFATAATGIMFSRDDRRPRFKR
jgi:hypothetical protein